VALLYKNIEELISKAEQLSCPLWKVILENEMKYSEMSEEDVFLELDRHYKVMEDSAAKALDRTSHTVGGLIEGIAAKQRLHALSGESICGDFINLVMARALSSSEVNASMGKICAAPTAGACGIIPAILISIGEKYDLSRRRILKGLLTASGVGAVIVKHASVAGSEAGCQAECGVAAAMAAAACVELRGGPPKAAAHALSFALMNAMGLVCDPIAGLVQVPCAQRNASQAVNALLSADLALSGMECIIPADEMIDAMYRVGKMLPPELRETAQGGIAATKTAQRIRRELF